MAGGNSQATGTVYLDTSSAQYALDKLNNKIGEYDKELAKVNITQGRRITLETNRAEAAKKAIAVEQQLAKNLGNTYNQQKDLVFALQKQLQSIPVNTQQYIDKLKSLRKEQGVFDEMKQKIKGVEVAQEQMASGFGKILGRVAAYGTAFLAFDTIKNSIVSFFGDAIDEANTAEAAVSRLGSTLSNLGRSDTFDRVTAKADELANTFKFIDNDDVTEVFQQLITYGKLTEKQMNDLLPVIINFASKSGTTINESASLIIKALEGNGKALKEYGISMKDGATVTERMALIMTELKPKVEGAAQAFGETLKGSIAESNQEIANTKEEIGNKLLPVLKLFYQSVSLTMSGLKTIFENTSIAFGATYNAMKLTFGVAKDVLSLNPTGAATRIGIAKAELDNNILIIKSQDEMAASRKSAASIAADASSKTLKEQEKILAGEKALKEADFQAYNALVAAGKARTEEGRKAAQQLFRSVETVKQLEKVIAGTKDTRTFGGDAGESAADKEAAKAKAAAAAKKAAAESKRILDDYNAFARQLNKDVTGLLTPEDSKKWLAVRQEAEEGLRRINEMVLTNAQRQELVNLVLERQRIKYRELAAELAVTVERTKEAVPAGADKPTNVKTPVEIIPIIPEADAADFEDAMNELFERIRGTDLTNLAAHLETYLQYAQQVTDIYAQMQQAKTDKEQAAFNKEISDNDRRKKSIQDLANQQVISKSDARRQIAAIEQEEEKKRVELDKKAFERNKKTSMLQAGINGALAITSILAQYPKFDGGIAMAIALGVAAATTVAQVALIASKKYSKGGIAKGASHAEGGIDMIDSKTGSKVGEMEGNEPYMILSGATYRNNKPIVDSLLDSSLNRGGAPIRQFWETRPYRSINYEAVTQSMKEVKFATGGVRNGTFTTNSRVEVPVQDPAVMEALQISQQVNTALLGTISRLNAQLEEGINVSLYKLNQATQQSDRIDDDSILR